MLPLFKRIALTSVVAASLAGLFFALNYYTQPRLTIYQDTCQNVEEVEAGIENALMLVANTLSFDDLDDELGGPCE